MRILIVSPDEGFVEILQAFLWDHGHEGEIACDGLECITVLREFQPDLLVLYDDLPWGGSEGVLAWLREQPVLSEIPVILVTEPGAREHSNGGVAAPIVSRLQKPFRLNDLLVHINSKNNRPARFEFSRVGDP